MIQTQSGYTNNAVFKDQTFGTFAIKIRDEVLNLLKVTQTPLEVRKFSKGCVIESK
jgi:hypothetical protein